MLNVSLWNHSSFILSPVCLGGAYYHLSSGCGGHMTQTKSLEMSLGLLLELCGERITLFSGTVDYKVYINLKLQVVIFVSPNAYMKLRPTQRKAELRYEK